MLCQLYAAAYTIFTFLYSFFCNFFGNIAKISYMCWDLRATFVTDCLSNKPSNKYLWESSNLRELAPVCFSGLFGFVLSIFYVRSTQKTRNSTRKNSKKYEISTANNSSTPERKWFIDFEYNNINGIMNIFHIFLPIFSPIFNNLFDIFANSMTCSL